MNSFRPLIYLSDGANATRCFCRGSGLVQVVLSVAMARSWPCFRSSISDSQVSANPTYRELIGNYALRSY